MKLYSHPRSGTNWTLALLERAFHGDVTYTQAKTGHWSQRVKVRAPLSKMRGSHQFYERALPGPRLYLFRDGRDVALSLWRTKAFQPKSTRSLSFSEFLRTPLDWHGTPGRRMKPRWTVAQHWKHHLDSWLRARDTCFVRYELLLRDPLVELRRIADWAGLPAPDASATIAGTGPYPSGDYRASKWEDAMTGADLDYFYGIVPEEHWGLWKEGTYGS